MKEEIHPEMHEVKIQCACGEEYETISTEEDLHVDVCSNCHPFYTGESRFLDSEGRISKFERKYDMESDEEEREEVETDVETDEEESEEEPSVEMEVEKSEE